MQIVILKHARWCSSQQVNIKNICNIHDYKLNESTKNYFDCELSVLCLIMNKLSIEQKCMFTAPRMIGCSKDGHRICPVCNNYEKFVLISTSANIVPSHDAFVPWKEVVFPSCKIYCRE